MGLLREMIINAAGEAAHEAVRGVVSGVASGAAVALDAVGKGINKVTNLAARISTPVTKKKVQKLASECEDLYLFSISDKDLDCIIQVYTSDIEMCLTLSKDNRRDVYYLRSMDGALVARFKVRKKLFGESCNIELSDGTSHLLTSVSDAKDKTCFEYDNRIRIVRNNVLSDYDYYCDGVKIATLKPGPAINVDRVLQIYDGTQDFDTVLMTVGKIIL